MVCAPLRRVRAGRRRAVAPVIVASLLAILPPAAALLAILPPAAALAAETDGGPPALITADELNHDRDLGIITARGNVEVSYEGRVLLADAISYNTKQDLITANGTISLLETDGTVFFANYFELSGDMKRGVGRELRVLLTDGARLAAASGTRETGIGHTLNKAVYTACQPCEGKPDRDPIWQIKAVNILHDEVARQIEYRDAWLEMWGLPVVYTPFLSHPDPSVKRRTGLLAPTFGGTRNLGATMRVPFHWVLTPQADVTVTPLFTSEHWPVMAGEYRQSYVGGESKVEGSLAHDEFGDTRGHFRSDLTYEIDDVWRSRLQVDRATDDTYLRRYGFGNKPFLVSHGRVEGFGTRSYATAQTYAFQGLRRDSDPGESPIVLPVLDYNYIGETDRLGGHSTLDANALVLFRDELADSRRISVTGGWTRPWYLAGGDVVTLGTSLRSDGYFVTDERQPDGSYFSGFAGRVIPEVSVDWRYPLVRHAESGSYQVVEPQVAMIASPYGANPDEIPNIDSRDLEFDDTNLFEPNRFTGFDRVETGPRLNYGLKVGHYFRSGGRMGAMLGQTYRVHTQPDFGIGTGLEDNFSDYVGRVDIEPTGHVALRYRFRIDKDDLAAHRSEVGATVGPPALSLTTDYIFINQTIHEGAEFGDREEIDLHLSSAVTRYWKAIAFGRYDLTEDGGPITIGGGGAYEDECFIWNALISRDYTVDRDYSGGITVMTRLVFKTLGQVQTSY